MKKNKVERIELNSNSSKKQEKTTPLNLPQLEEKILKFWQEKKIFWKSLEKNKKSKSFIFFEGPPTANGKPGLHHVLARAFKDLIPRYKTMQGYYVERKAGWDTHGLPVELEVEKQIGLSGKKQIEDYGINKFNEECKESVWKYKDEWEKMTRRIGFWLDLNNPYITYSNDYIESLWWIIKQIWDKGWLYKGHKVVPYCPRCGTSLSSHEVAQGYEAITETSIYIKFKVKDQKNTYILSWTTTPWTLPGNVALAVGANFDYVKIKVGEEFYILAKDRLNIIEEKYEIVEEMRGRDLEGVEYEPLFNFVKSDKKAHYVALADFVTTEEGTGIVHTAVMYGEDDYNLGEKLDLPKIHTVDQEGRFVKEVKPWAGRFVKEVEKEITEDLKKRHLLYKTETITHDYPFCWRCESPLLYYAKDSWFIKMTSLRKKLIQNNQKINWIPAYIKDGRFGEWLTEVKDWALSRERYWGTPLPIWICNKCQEKKVIGSRKELGQEIDLHRPFIDKIEFECKCGGKMKRVPEVIDCWFDSGSMPFAQWHYPFENKEKIDKGKSFPADYIAEAIDQTRGWFYTLLAISTLLGKGPAYLNVISLGLILDAKGEKMSKSKGNVIEPEEVIDKYGADALRWYFYTVNQPGDSKIFNPKHLNDIIKKNFLVLWNVYSFYKTYAQETNQKPETKSKDILDRWILAKLNSLIQETTDHLDKFQIIETGRKISTFINELSTWYLRRSRERFKSSDPKIYSEALSTLSQVLLNLAKLLAPFIPFQAEELYQKLARDKESVHLENWPKGEKKLIDKKLLEEMNLALEAVELGHSIRMEKGLKVRQPLSQLVILGPKLTSAILDLVKDEINVKEVVLAPKLPEGPEWGKRKNKNLELALKVTITDDLKTEGIIRELVRQINEMRKKAKLTIKDKIEIYYQTPDSNLESLLKKADQEIKEKTLAQEILALEPALSLDLEKYLEIEGRKIKLGIKVI